MVQEDPFQEAFANVLTKKIIQVTPEPLKSILREQQKLANKAKNDLATERTKEQLLHSQTATQQLLTALNAEIRNLQGEIVSTNQRNDELQKRNEILTWISIVLGVLSLILGVVTILPR